jgi:hypothetical protein
MSSCFARAWILVSHQIRDVALVAAALRAV